MASATSGDIGLNHAIVSTRDYFNKKLSAFARQNLDVDEQGRVFWCLLPILLLLLVGRGLYVCLSGVPSQAFDEKVIPTFIAIAALIATSLVTQRYRLVEATLLWRAGAMFLSTLLWSPSMCVFAFHTGRGFPFADHGLAALDRAIGFSWIAYVRLVDGSPALWTMMKIAYTSIVPQLVAVLVVLAFMRSAQRVYVYVFAQTLALTACAAIAVFVPSLGAYVQADAAHAGLLHSDFITADNMTSSIVWLRNETVGPGGIAVIGLITFPSYHTVCAVLFAWVFWSVPYVRWGGLGLNLMMVAATPIQGSHYLVDLIAGALIAVLALIASQRLVSWVTSCAAIDKRLLLDRTGRRCRV